MKKLLRRLWPITSAIALLIQSTATAAVNDGERLCDAALTATRTELAGPQGARHRRPGARDAAPPQRDDAFKMLEAQPPTMPWYFWTILGGAAAATAFELRR
jgi:hypothetical protein